MANIAGKTDYSGTTEKTPGILRRTSYTIDELRATHLTYDKYEDEWSFFQAAYDGARAMVTYGVILRHERESNKNFERREDEAYGFSYSTSVVDLFNFYLFKEQVLRQLGKLGKDDIWKMFTDDANLHKDDLDSVLLAAGRAASIQGS